MTVSPQIAPQVGKMSDSAVSYARGPLELARLRKENRALRRRVTELEAGRARWRTEARNWKWHALGWRQTRYV